MAKKNWIRKILALTVVFALAASLTVTGVAAAPGGFWGWPYWPGGGGGDDDLYEWYEVYVQGQLAASDKGSAGDYYWLGTHYEADYRVSGSTLYWEIVPLGVNNGKYSGSVDLTDYIGEIPEGYEVDKVVLESGSIDGVNDPVHDMYDNAVITITIKTLYNETTGDEIIVDPEPPEPPKPDPYTVSKQVKNAEGQWADSASFVLAEGETELRVEYRLVISGTAGTEYVVADDLADRTFTGTIGENGEAVETYILTLGVGESINAISYDGDQDEETDDETDEVAVTVEEAPEPPKPDPYTVSKQVKNAEGQWADSASFVLAEGETELRVEYRLVISGTAGTEYVVADDLADRTFTGTIGENGEAVETYILTLGVGESINAISYDDDQDPETPNREEEIPVVIEEPEIPEPPAPPAKPDPYTVSKQVEDEYGNWADSAAFTMGEDENRMYVHYRLVISGTAGTEYAVYDDLAEKTFTGIIDEDGESIVNYSLRLKKGTHINTATYDGDHDPETADESDSVSVRIKKRIIVVPADPKPDPIEPDPVEPDPVEPDPVEPDPVEPDPVEPDPIEPDPIEPDPVEPDPIEPDPVEPDPVEPDPVEPDPIEPDPIEPDPVEPVIEIPEEEVPLVEIPEEEVPLVEIPEEEVPLAEVPKTGSAVLAYSVLTAVSGLSLAWLGLKKKEN